MNSEWAAGGMPMAPVPLDHPDMAAGSGASPHSSQSSSHGGHSHHSSSRPHPQHAGHLPQYPPLNSKHYHSQQQQQQYNSSQQGGAGGGVHHHHQNTHHMTYQQYQPTTESSNPLDKHKQPLQQRHRPDYEGSNSSTGGSGFNANPGGMENPSSGGGGGVGDLAEMRQSFTSSNDDGPEDWQEREERLLIKQQQMLTELKRSQKAEQKAKARISELRTSLREALKENEDLLKDMEKMIFNYETLEKKHEVLTEVCSDLQQQLEVSGGGDGSGTRASSRKDRSDGQSNDVDAELLERMEQEQDFLIQKLEISQQNCQAWKDRAHAMKQHKKDLKKKCKHLESILRGCPNCQYELQQYHQHLPSSHVGSHNHSHSHSSPEELSSSVSPGYGSSQGQSIGGKHLQALNAGMQILNQQQQLSPRAQMQQQQRPEANPKHQYSQQQQQQSNQQMQQQKHQRRGSNASVGSQQSFNSHGTPRYHHGTSNVGNKAPPSQSMSNSDSRSISSRSTTRKAGQQPSAMDRLVAMAKHSTSVRQLQHVHAERQQQQAFDKDADDDDDRSISTRGSGASSRGAGAQSTRSSVKNGPTRHNRRPSFDLEDSGSSGSSDEKDQRKDLTRQKSLELFGSVRGHESGNGGGGGGGDQGCDVNSVAESYKQAKEIIQSRRKRRTTAATSQAAHSQHYMNAQQDGMSLRSHGDSQRMINVYNDPENDDEARSLHDSGELGGSSFYDGSTMTSDSNLRRSSGESIQLVIVPGDGSGESQTLEIKAGHKNKGGSIILMGGGSGAGNLGDHSRNRRRSSLEFNPSSSAAAHASRHMRNHEPLLQQPDYHNDHDESEQDISEMHESETSSLASWDRARRNIDQHRNAQQGNVGYSAPGGIDYPPEEINHDRHMANQRANYMKQKHSSAVGGAAGMPKVAAGEEHEMTQKFDAFRNRRSSNEERRDGTGVSPYSLNPNIKSKARAA